MTVVWLTPEDAARAIENARRAHVPLLGFDAAYVRQDSIQPSLEDSWDYSGGPGSAVDDPYAHAIQFILDRGQKGLRFELVFGKRFSN
jgi:hypothetical protein